MTNRCYCFPVNLLKLRDTIPQSVFQELVFTFFLIYLYTVVFNTHALGNVALDWIVIKLWLPLHPSRMRNRMLDVFVSKKNMWFWNENNNTEWQISHHLISSGCEVRDSQKSKLNHCTSKEANGEKTKRQKRKLLFKMWKQNHRKIIPGGKNLAICNLIGFRNFYYCNLETPNFGHSYSHQTNLRNRRFM